MPKKKSIGPNLDALKEQRKEVTASEPFEINWIFPDDEVILFPIYMEGDETGFSEATSYYGQGEKASPTRRMCFFNVLAFRGTMPDHNDRLGFWVGPVTVFESLVDLTDEGMLDWGWVSEDGEIQLGTMIKIKRNKTPNKTTYSVLPTTKLPEGFEVPDVESEEFQVVHRPVQEEAQRYTEWAHGYAFGTDNNNGEANMDWAE